MPIIRGEAGFLAAQQRPGERPDTDVWAGGISSGVKLVVLGTKFRRAERPDMDVWAGCRSSRTC